MTWTAIGHDIFRAYDIRGIVDAGLTPGVMAQLGRAIGSEALDLGETRLVVAADARLSSPAFSEAMMTGIRAAGCDVIHIGMVPTPVLYYATHELDTRSGVMITGSHNPGHYNGVKIVLNGRCLADDLIRNIHNRILEGRLHAGAGRLVERAVTGDYIRRIAGDLAVHRPFRVVVDAGNGVTGSVAPRLFEALNAEVVPLYCEPDGHFPNHHPDPTVEENLHDLTARVVAEGADLGMAFDGDGDRVVLVSDRGAVIDADSMMMLFARDILPDNPGARIVFDVKSSSRLRKLITEGNGEPVMCRSGHSYVKRRMLETGALLGGEYTAHIFFRHRWYGFDDGMYTAARFLELMARHGCSSHTLLDTLPALHSTKELFIDVPEERKFPLMERIRQEIRLDGATVNTLDGVRADFPEGWGLIRASNTTPRLVLRFEAETPDSLDAIRAIFRRELQRIDASLSLSF